MEETLEYISSLNDIKKTFKKVNPSWVKITTITVVAKLNTDLKVDLIRSIFDELECLKLRPKGSTYRGHTWVLSQTTFYNQVSLCYQDSRSKKSIKLFPNGSIQVAGCVDLLDCRNVIEQVRAIVALTHNMKVPPLCAACKIAMINTNFSLNMKLSQYGVTDVFTKSGYNVSFDPDRYSAVKVKFEPVEGGKRVTASIFSTGKVIVTGAENLKEIAGAYRTIVDTIEKNHKDTYAAESPTCDVFPDFMGYTWDQWLEYMDNKISS
jgi:TATA-box binding protein (TBP) (component of TFIID and TFIIIB)